MCNYFNLYIHITGEKTKTRSKRCEGQGERTKKLPKTSGERAKTNDTGRCYDNQTTTPQEKEGARGKKSTRVLSHVYHIQAEENTSKIEKKSRIASDDKQGEENTPDEALETRSCWCGELDNLDMVECTTHAQCGGWVHFACEQLSEEEIEQVVQEADEHPYICCLCREHGAESDDGESENSDEDDEDEDEDQY